MPNRKTVILNKKSPFGVRIDGVNAPIILEAYAIETKTEEEAIAFAKDLDEVMRKYDIPVEVIRYEFES